MKSNKNEKNVATTYEVNVDLKAWNEKIEYLNSVEWTPDIEMAKALVNLYFTNNFMKL